MAEDIFLKLDDVEGESKDSSHKKEIQLQSTGYSVRQQGAQGAGGGGGAGKASFDDISCMAETSKASPLLWLSCATGKHHAKAVIIYRKAGEKPLEYLKIELEDVLVSSFNSSEGAGGSIPVDSFSLNFGKIKVEYTPQDAKGGGEGVVKAGYDVKGNLKI